VPELVSSQNLSTTVLLGVEGRECECGVLVNVASMAARAIMLDLETIGFSMYLTIESIPDVT